MQRSVRMGSLVGLMLVGAYLTDIHWLHQPVACPAQGFINCQVVLTGPDSMILGVTVSKKASPLAPQGVRGVEPVLYTG